MENVTLASSQIVVQISPIGAEVVRLQNCMGQDLLWDGDPCFWKGRSPILFPIVGKLPNDRVLINGNIYAIQQHGFARQSTFDLVSASESTCRFQLIANDETRCIFPFEFRVIVDYEIVHSTLQVIATVENTSPKPMPASFGFHPAFRWPLPNAGPRSAHKLIFDYNETQPIRRLQNGLLNPISAKNPVFNREIQLSDQLFENDVVIFDVLKSRGITYSGEGSQSLRIDFPDMPHLGLWSRPGAGFVCIEPWQGFSTPHDFNGELSTKPGIVKISSGGRRLFCIAITVR